MGLMPLVWKIPIKSQVGHYGKLREEIYNDTQVREKKTNAIGFVIFNLFFKTSIQILTW